MDRQNLGMTSPGRVAIATSIPPKLKRTNATIAIDEAYQALCIQSWTECGFRILSVNHGDEIPALAARYPQVEFVPTDRNASLGEGRRPPFIADILHALSSAPEEKVGIVNSDLLFEPGDAWRSFLAKMPERTIVTGQRYDTNSLLNNTAYRYFWGFDYFFFARDLAAPLADEAKSFAMGLPWWDYWFPMVLALRGYRIVSLERPATIHLVHSQSESTLAHTPPWRNYGLQLTQRLATEPRDLAQPLPAHLSEVRAHCRELLSLASQSSTHFMEIDERLIKLAQMCVRCIGGEIHSAVTGPGKPPANGQAAVFTPSAIFATFPSRLQAGKLFSQATESEHQGKSEEAWALYRQAFAAAPNDSEILAAFARFHSQRGDYAQAESVLCKAIANMPNSAHLWNSLGTTVGALNRLTDAIACFERALSIDPKSRDGHYYLALALYTAGQREEALSRLAAGFAAVSDFPQGRELEATIRREQAGGS